MSAYMEKEMSHTTEGVEILVPKEQPGNRGSCVIQEILSIHFLSESLSMCLFYFSFENLVSPSFVSVL